jgi:methionyl-tRNA formyltransferase
VNGETETGVSIMQMDEGLDTGDVLAMDKVEILPDDNALSVLNVLSVMGAHALVEVLDAIESGRKMEVRRQADMGESSYAPLMTKEDGWIDWTQTTEEIICHINGFQPWPGAYAKFESGDQMAMNQAQPWEGDWPAYSNEADPGQVLDRVKGKGFLVKTGSGILLLTRVKPKSKDEMDAFSTWNGKYVDEKTTFVSPKKKIIESTESV